MCNKKCVLCLFEHFVISTAAEIQVQLFITPVDSLGCLLFAFEDFLSFYFEKKLIDN